MGKNWRNCIVTLIDIVGVRSQAQNSTGSRIMLDLHRKVLTEIRDNKYSFIHTYIYNDAVLILSYVDRTKDSFQIAMHDADRLKKRIDEIDDNPRKSYAIAVKGQAFPNVHYETGTSVTTPVTIIETSSWAMANCFEIEKEMKNLCIKKPWYVDERIARKIQTEQEYEKHAVSLYPSSQPRNIYCFKGYLWNL